MAALSVFGCTTNTNYVGEESSYSLPDLDYGLLQSPINILTDSLTEGHHQIKVNYDSSHLEITHLEHTIKVNYDTGSILQFDGRVYEFQQFHFHTPAEHLIDGITYPMEVHMVHTQKDTASKTTHYFVLAALFKMGHTNKDLQEFIDLIPDEIGGIDHRRSTFYNIVNIVGGDIGEYYHYTGSLTTPPYTETVNWAILHYVLEASPNQIAQINKIEGNNARHIHSVNGRKIEIIHL